MLLLRRYGRPVRDALILVGLARAVYYFFVQGIQPWTFVGVDARAYWGIDLTHPYLNSGLGELSTYLLFARSSPRSWHPSPTCRSSRLTPGGPSSWRRRACGWCRPWPWAVLILFLPVSYELFVGNIHFLIAAAIVLGFRFPATWALPRS